MTALELRHSTLNRLLARPENRVGSCCGEVEPSFLQKGSSLSRGAWHRRFRQKALPDRTREGIHMCSTLPQLHEVIGTMPSLKALTCAARAHTECTRMSACLCTDREDGLVSLRRLGSAGMDHAFLRPLLQTLAREDRRTSITHLSLRGSCASWAMTSCFDVLTNLLTQSRTLVRRVRRRHQTLQVQLRHGVRVVSHTSSITHGRESHAIVCLAVSMLTTLEL